MDEFVSKLKVEGYHGGSVHKGLATLNVRTRVQISGTHTKTRQALRWPVIPELGRPLPRLSETSCGATRQNEQALGSGRNPAAINKVDRDQGRLWTSTSGLHTTHMNLRVRTQTHYIHV